MAVISLTDRQKQLVEQLGVAQEKMGLTPAGSRIIALLLISDVPELTFDDIYETLNLSKSSTSTALTMLTAMQRVEYITKLGERRRYFRASMAQMEEQTSSKFDDLIRLRNILQEIYDQRPPSTQEFNYRLHKMLMFMEFIQQEFPDIMRRWKEKVSQFESNQDKPS